MQPLGFCFHPACREKERLHFMPYICILCQSTHKTGISDIVTSLNEKQPGTGQTDADENEKK